MIEKAVQIIALYPCDIVGRITALSIYKVSDLFASFSLLISCTFSLNTKELISPNLWTSNNHHLVPVLSHFCFRVIKKKCIQYIWLISFLFLLNTSVLCYFYSTLPGSPGRIICAASWLCHAHNPICIDTTPEQWEIIGDVIQDTNHIPYFDVIYQLYLSGCLWFCLLYSKQLFHFYFALCLIKSMLKR